MRVKKQTIRIIWATTFSLFILLSTIHITTFIPTFKQLQKEQLNLHKLKIESILQNQEKDVSNLHSQILQLDKHLLKKRNNVNILRTSKIHGYLIFNKKKGIVKNLYKSKQIPSTDLTEIIDVLKSYLSVYNNESISGLYQIKRKVYQIDTKRTHPTSRYNKNYSILIRRLYHQCFHKALEDHESMDYFKIQFDYGFIQKEKSQSPPNLSDHINTYISKSKYCHSQIMIMSNFCHYPIVWDIQYYPSIINKAKRQTVIEIILLLLLLVSFSQTIIRILENKINSPLREIVSQIEEMESLDMIDPITLQSGPRELQILSNKLNQLFNEFNTQQTLFHRNNDNLSNALIQSKISEKQIVSFFSNMSHDIRTPLNAIIGFSELITENTCNEIERREYSHIVIDNGNKLIDYIENMIQLSKLINNTLTPNKKYVRLEDLVRKIKVHTNKLSELHEKDHLDKVFCIQNNILEEVIYTDENLLAKALYNLISNAIKFTNEGYIKIDLEVKEDSTLITISDTGVGIRAEFIDHLGKEFLQEEDTYTKSIEGTGIGLSITYRIIKILGGELNIKSSKNKGTEIQISIPLLR